MKKLYLSLYSLFSLVLVVLLGLGIKNQNQAYFMDRQLMDFISQRVSSKGLTIMTFITNLGSAVFLILLALAWIYYLYRRASPRILSYLLINSLALSYLLNVLLKTYFTRLRPIEYMLIDQSGYSFPSGHSMVAMSFYLSLAYVVASGFSSKLTRLTIYLINISLALAIGYSRIYLGVHWPSDVLAGLLMGSLLGAWGIYIVEARS